MAPAPRLKEGQQVDGCAWGQRRGESRVSIFHEGDSLNEKRLPGKSRDAKNRRRRAGFCKYRRRRAGFCKYRRRRVGFCKYRRWRVGFRKHLRRRCENSKVLLSWNLLDCYFGLAFDPFPLL
jgi:hypothetical protein